MVGPMKLGSGEADREALLGSSSGSEPPVSSQTSFDTDASKIVIADSSSDEEDDGGSSRRRPPRMIRGKGARAPFERRAVHINAFDGRTSDRHSCIGQCMRFTRQRKLLVLCFLALVALAIGFIAYASHGRVNTIVLDNDTEPPVTTTDTNGTNETSLTLTPVTNSTMATVTPTVAVNETATVTPTVAVNETATVTPTATANATVTTSTTPVNETVTSTVRVNGTSVNGTSVNGTSA
jgi:hypothetical protein